MPVLLEGYSTLLGCGSGCSMLLPCCRSRSSPSFRRDANFVSNHSSLTRRRSPQKPERAAAPLSHARTHATAAHGQRRQHVAARGGRRDPQGVPPAFAAAQTQHNTRQTPATESPSGDVRCGCAVTVGDIKRLFKRFRRIDREQRGFITFVVGRPHKAHSTELSKANEQ